MDPLTQLILNYLAPGALPRFHGWLPNRKSVHTRGKDTLTPLDCSLSRTSIAITEFSRSVPKDSMLLRYQYGAPSLLLVVLLDMTTFLLSS